MIMVAVEGLVKPSSLVTALGQAALGAVHTSVVDLFKLPVDAY
jgi:hypothetical protein